MHSLFWCCVFLFEYFQPKFPPKCRVVKGPRLNFDERLHIYFIWHIFPCCQGCLLCNMRVCLFTSLIPFWLMPHQDIFLSFTLSLTLSGSALRAPRRRYSSGGEEDGWSHGLQRVRLWNIHSLVSLSGVWSVIKAYRRYSVPGFYYQRSAIKLRHINLLGDSQTI